MGVVNAVVGVLRSIQLGASDQLNNQFIFERIHCTVELVNDRYRIG
jgi:hypothetical protein